GHRQVAPPRPEVADRDADAWTQLLLELNARLIVVFTLVPARPRVVGQVQVRNRLPEGVVADGAAFSVRRGIGQFAAGYEISVRVGPRAADALDDCYRGRKPLLAEPPTLAHEVLPEKGLDRGFAVTEHVERPADTRRDVLEI